jgi:hypothetical protein
MAIDKVDFEKNIEIAFRAIALDQGLKNEFFQAWFSWDNFGERQLEYLDNHNLIDIVLPSADGDNS